MKIQNDVLGTAKLEGKIEGRAEGLAIGKEEGLKEGILLNARKMKEKGFSMDDIADITGLSFEEIETL